MYPLLALFGGLFTFGLASVVGGSGFLAVYIAGLVLAQRVSRGLYNIQRFFDGAAWLCQISMFLILGLLVTPSEMLPYAGQALAVAMVLILFARPLAVFLCLLPFRFAWREQAFISWVGLRGAVPIILAMFPWIAGLEQWHFFFNLAFFVVLVSLVIQGWTVAPLARLLHLEVPSRSGRMQRVELGMPGQEEYELVGYRVESDSRVINAPAEQVQWPEGVNLLFGIRDGQVVRSAELRSLQPGDQVYFLAFPGSLADLDRMMVGEREPERLGEREFFGAFVIRPDANLGELGRIYGFRVDDEFASLSIGDYLLRRFPRPVVGDRVRLGPVDFVVRETEGDHIRQVGLKILPA
jgi:cell volume regulation protein A